MIDGEVTFPREKDMSRFDGSLWTRFKIDGGFVVFTEEGQKLLSGDRSLRRVLSLYREDIEQKRGDRGVVRRWFKAGGKSQVYTVGDYPLVMKEASYISPAWDALHRMDYLHHVCQKALHPAIKVPVHYAAVISTRLKSQYLLMEKVNDGLTVEDVLDSDAYEDYHKIVEKEFGKARRLINDAIGAVPDRANWPADLLPDWAEKNVIVDFSLPVEGLPFTLWVIDQ